MSIIDLNSVSALYPVIAVENPDATASDFEALLPVERVFDSDWYVQLLSPNGALQLGLLRFDHDSMPANHQTRASGMLVTVDTEDANGVWTSLNERFEIVQPLRDEEWGQRHFILKLTGGFLIAFNKVIP